MKKLYRNLQYSKQRKNITRFNRALVTWWIGEILEIKGLNCIKKLGNR